MQALCYAIGHGEGIIKVVGEVGSGKTMLCRMLPHTLKGNVDWVYLAHPRLQPDQMLREIARELDIPITAESDKLNVMRELQASLLTRHSANRQVVVLVEEAQEMPLETLEELRLLSNLETDEHKLLQIVLFGQPELDENLALRKIRQLRERITHSVCLQPLESPDIEAYLNFRLQACGYVDKPLFDAAVSQAIYDYSHGLIRRINILGDKVLLSAYAKGRDSVNISDVELAAKDSQYTTNRWWTVPEALQN